jgi:hypothetical protein
VLRTSNNIAVGAVSGDGPRCTMRSLRCRGAQHFLQFRLKQVECAGQKYPVLIPRLFYSASHRLLDTAILILSRSAGQFPKPFDKFDRVESLIHSTCRKMPMRVRKRTHAQLGFRQTIRHELFPFYMGFCAGFDAFRQPIRHVERTGYSGANATSPNPRLPHPVL